MRRLVGILLMVFAAFALVGGAAITILLGTDNRAATGPHQVDTDAAVVSTDPDVLGWAGATITVTVEVAADQQVFIGAANAVDVADYVQSTRRTEVTDYGLPWDIATRDVDGESVLPSAPGGVDWWVAQNAGTGTASLSIELPEQAFSIVVVAVGGGSLAGLEVTASYDVNGGFGIGLGLVGFGVGLGLFGWIAVQGRPMVRGADEDELDDDADEGADDEGEGDDQAEEKGADDRDVERVGTSAEGDEK